jgi:hypothetical protein
MERSLNASNYNHHAFGQFLSLGIGLNVLGDGQVRFANFI